MRWRGLTLSLCLLPAIASAADAPSDAPRSEVGLAVGAYTTTQTYEGGGTTDAFAYLGLQGKGRFTFGSVPPLTLDGWLLTAPVMTAGGSPTSFSAAARVGIELSHFTAAIGPVVNFAPGSPNLAQWLPSLTLQAGAGSWWGDLGLFDRPELPILRAGLVYRNPTLELGLAYVMLAGGELRAGWWINSVLRLDGRLLISKQPLGNGLSTLVVGATLALPGVRL